MLQPSKTKYRKCQKMISEGVAQRGYRPSFGSFVLKSLECEYISAKQIETIRVMISKILGKTGKMWIRVFPDIPVTRKPAEVRMGSGKGNVEFYASFVKSGTILFEVDGVAKDIVCNTLKNAGKKLHFKTVVVNCSYE